MGQARSANQREPERVKLRFQFDLVRDLPTDIARYAVLQSLDAQRGLAQFSSKLKAGLSKPGLDVEMDAPASAWNWLIGHAIHFSPDFCNAVIVQISDHEDRHERRRARLEQAENNAALKQAADELRAREAEEKRREAAQGVAVD